MKDWPDLPSLLFLGKLSIRKATLADAELLSEIGASTFRETYVSLLKPGDLEPRIQSKYSVEIQSRELNDPTTHLFIAFSHDENLGYAKLRTTDKSKHVPHSNLAHLERLYVQSSQTRKGVGKALIKSCAEEAKKLGFYGLWLGVMKGNERALRFYLQCGFNGVGEEPFQIGNNTYSDIIMMTRFEDV